MKPPVRFETEVKRRAGLEFAYCSKVVSDCVLSLSVLYLQTVVDRRHLPVVRCVPVSHALDVVQRHLHRGCRDLNRCSGICAD
eukprot:COSAG02_NODE_7140_length_3160_cov_24.772623_2_plen_83_part_00